MKEAMSDKNEKSGISVSRNNPREIKEPIV